MCWHALNSERYQRLWGLIPGGDVDCCGGEREDVVTSKPQTIMGGPVRWAVGVTTVPEREILLHRTLGSLAVGGFTSPQVFVERGLRAFGTWWHGLLEMWIRDGQADRYAMFQDDVVCCKNLRQYLDGVPHPERGYWNLWTANSNEAVVKEAGPRTGFRESSIRKTSPHDPNCREQTGQGALALVFPRKALVELLTSLHLVTRPMDRPPLNEQRGEERYMADRNIDGCVVTAMNKAGYREYVHAPSLVQHVGDESVISGVVERQLAAAGKRRPPRVAKSFPGESFDALSWIEKTV